MWYVYILECADKSLYTGVTNNLQRRVEEHNFSKLGAKYTRGRRPVELVYVKKVKDKAKALQEEYLIKKLSRYEKIKKCKK